MGGFRSDEMSRALGLPDGVMALTVMAVGRLDQDAKLPEPLDQREVAARQRLPLDDIVLRGW